MVKTDILNEVKKIRNLINSTKVNYPHLVSSDLQTGKFEVNKIFLSSVISKFSQINLGLILVKSPRREDDSIILLVTNTIPLIGIKFLPDVWIATSEHVRKPHFLEKISTSKFLPTVYYSKIDKSSNSITYIFEYIKETPLSELFKYLSTKQKKTILVRLKVCIEELVTKYRLDVNVDDLSDFVLSPKDISGIILVDYNSYFQASKLLSTEDLLRIVKHRALKTLTKAGFKRSDVYKVLFSPE